MSDSRKKPSWTFWAEALLVGLPTLYLASFGPACWLADRRIVAPDRTAAIYSPILTELRADDVLWSYGKLGCQDSFTMLHLFVLATVRPNTGQLRDGPPDS